MKYFLSIKLLLSISVCIVNAQVYTIEFLGEELRGIEKLGDHLILQTDRQKYFSQNGVTFQREEIKYDYVAPIHRYRTTGSTLQIQPKYLLDHNHSAVSIRSHGKNFFAGYPGVSIESHEISNIPYCSGAIRNFNNTYYICYDGLGIYDPSTHRTTLFTSSDKGELSIGGQKLGNLRDIALKKNTFYLLTSTGLYASDLNFKKCREIFLSDTPYENAEFVIYHEDYPVLNFIHSNGFYTYNVENGKIDTLLSLANIDCINYDDKYIYFMGNSHAYVYKKQFLELSELVDSIPGQFVACIYQDDKYIAFGLDGLWVYSKEWYRLNNIEYNRRSVLISGDTVRAGSTSGMYTYLITDLLSYPSLLNSSKSANQSSLFPFLTVSGTLVSVLIIILLALKFIRFQKTSQSAPLERSEIEVYILNNLKTITVERICLYFGITNIELNERFTDISPASFIKNSRMELAKYCYENGESIDYISNATGYSKSYLIKFVLPSLKRNMNKH